MMTKIQLLGAFVGFVTLANAVQAGPPVRVGIGVNIGAPAYRPYYAPYYGPYYRPYYYPPAVIVAPPPVVYQQAPVVVQQQQPIYAPQPAPIASGPQQTTYEAARPNASVDGFLANLRSSDEAIRRDSVMELGRMKAAIAVQPLTATLAGDQSPVVRESAARALGLIGAPQSLTALQHSAQADPDRDVRNSARFAVDIIKSNSH